MFLIEVSLSLGETGVSDGGVPWSRRISDGGVP